MNSRQDGIEVYANNVTIEYCKLHHFIAGSFDQQLVPVNK